MESKLPHYACRSCKNLLGFHSTIVSPPGTNQMLEINGHVLIIFKTIVNVEDEPERNRIDVMGWHFQSKICARCKLGVGWTFVQPPNPLIATAGMGILLKDQIITWNGGFYEEDFEECPPFYLCRCGIYLALQEHIIHSSDNLIQPRFATLFSIVENVETPSNEQNASFGPYGIQKVHCSQCRKFLGHKFVEVPPQDSLVVEGTFSLRKNCMLKREGNQVMDAATLKPRRVRYYIPNMINIPV